MAERRRDKVRDAYLSMGIDRREIARRTGLNPSTITNAIAGAALGRAAAARIGQVIGWTADEVLAGERQEKTVVDQTRADQAEAQAESEAPAVTAAPEKAEALRRGVA